MSCNHLMTVSSGYSEKVIHYEVFQGLEHVVSIILL